MSEKDDEASESLFDHISIESWKSVHNRLEVKVTTCLFSQKNILMEAKWGMSIMNLIRTAGLVLIAFAALVEPALATVPVPAPIVGAGLPALILIGGAYWIGRKFFDHKE